jgi:hypothetical protein
MVRGAVVQKDIPRILSIDCRTALSLAENENVFNDYRSGDYGDYREQKDVPSWTLSADLDAENKNVFIG